jgi:hypothetical protein
VSRRHEEVCNREVMAAGSAHPRRVPGIEDPARRGGEKYHAHNRRAVCPQAWLVAVKNPAAALNRRGMVTAAGERPPPGDPITAIHDHGLPAMPGKLRKSRALVPRYQKFEYIPPATSQQRTRRGGLTLWAFPFRSRHRLYAEVPTSMGFASAVRFALAIRAVLSAYRTAVLISSNSALPSACEPAGSATRNHEVTVN